MKKILTFLISIIFFLGSSSKISADDVFPQLENLKIGEKIQPEILGLGKETKNENQDTIFLEFESGSKTYPHFIKIKPSGEIIYIELKIPETHLEIYHNILDSMGDPETKEQTSPSFVLLAYPSKGIGFIISERNSNFIIQTKYPPKTVSALKENEAKNFKEVSQIDTFPTGILDPIEPDSEVPKDLIYENTKKIERTKNITTYLVILLLFSSAILLFIYLKNKKKAKILTEEIISSPKRVSRPQIKKPDLVLKIKTPQDPL